MRIILFMLLLVWAVLGRAQLPEPVMGLVQGYGGNKDEYIGTRVTPTTDGGGIMAIGSLSTSHTGNIDSFCVIDGDRTIFVKFDANGSLQWSKCYVSDGDSSFFYLFPNNASGSTLIGSFNSASGWGCLICKLDASGSVLWNKNYSKGNGAQLADAIGTVDGGYLLLSTTIYVDTNALIHHGTPGGHADFWLLKVDSNGNKIWSTVLGGSYDEQPMALTAGPDGGCYVFGSTNSDDYDCTGYKGAIVGGVGTDAYLARIDGNGNLLWHKDLGGTGNEGNYGWCISDGNGGVVFATNAGSADGDVNGHIGDDDFWIVNIDSNGNFVWAKCIGTVGREQPLALCKGTDGSIWAAGICNQAGTYIASVYGGGDAWVAHLDDTGKFINGKVIGGYSADWSSMICPLADNKVMVGGVYNGLGGNLPTYYFGYSDVFISMFLPWSTGVSSVEGDNKQIVVYPNPATEEISINNLSAAQLSFKIVDVLGRPIRFGQIEKKQGLRVDIHDVTRGTYFLQMIAQDGSATNTKIMIN